ncbi:MAG: citrate (Si)-synthase, partial [Ignavibacteria bacterium]|nr:citrate (Si)-synthase [Ignavibacteria bacterium]
MSGLKQKLQEKIQIEKPRTDKLLKEFGNVKVDEVNIGQIIGGMRDIKSLVTDISYIDP